MKQQTSDFSSGSVIRHILSIALPMLLAQSVQMLYSVVDRIYIGHMPQGSLYVLSGLGLTFPIVTLISAFTALFAQGGAPLFAIACGRRDLKEASRLQSLTFMLLTGFSGILTVLCLLSARWALILFGASEQSLPYGLAYLHVYLLGTFFSMASTGMNSFLNAQGYSRIAMLTVLLGAAMNLVLDPLFIFTWNMGIAGAAWASVISQTVSCLWALRYLRTRAAIPLTWNASAFSWSQTGKIVSLGLAGFIALGSNAVVQAASNMALSLLNQEIYIGVMTVISSVRELITLPVSALTSSSQPVISYNYGAQKPQRIRQAVAFVTFGSLVFLFIGWGLCIGFPKELLSLFSDDQQILSLGVKAFLLHFAGIFMMGFQMSAQSIFVALNRSRQAIFFSLLRKIIIVVPLTFLLPYIGNLGVYGVFLSEPISNCIGGLASYSTMLVTLKKILGSMPADSPCERNI